MQSLKEKQKKLLGLLLQSLFIYIYVQTYINLHTYM